MAVMSKRRHRQRRVDGGDMDSFDRGKGERVDVALRKRTQDYWRSPDIVHIDKQPTASAER